MPLHTACASKTEDGGGGQSHPPERSISSREDILDIDTCLKVSFQKSTPYRNCSDIIGRSYRRVQNPYDVQVKRRIEHFLAGIHKKSH